MNIRNSQETRLDSAELPLISWSQSSVNGEILFRTLRGRARITGHYPDAAFGSPGRLLDFGVKRFALRPAGELGFASLLRALRPGVIVVRKIARGSKRDRPITKGAIRSMRRLSRQLSIRVVLVSEAGLRGCFVAHKLRTKQERAALLVRKFPALAWRLPPPRPIWRKEHWNMPIFDAVALGVTHFAEVTMRYSAATFPAREAEFFRRLLDRRSQKMGRRFPKEPTKELFVIFAQPYTGDLGVCNAILAC